MSAEHDPMSRGAFTMPVRVPDGRVLSVSAQGTPEISDYRADFSAGQEKNSMTSLEKILQNGGTPEVTGAISAQLMAVRANVIDAQRPVTDAVRAEAASEAARRRQAEIDRDANLGSGNAPHKIDTSWMTAA